MAAELVNSRCDGCNGQTFQCTLCAKQDVTVRKRMNAEKKERLLLVTKYNAYEFPAMPPPAALELDGYHHPSISSPFMNVLPAAVQTQVLPTTTPTKRPRDEVDEDDYAIDESFSRPPLKPAAVTTTPVKRATKKAAVEREAESDSASGSSSSDTCSNSSESEGEDATTPTIGKQGKKKVKNGGVQKKTKMPKITVAERSRVFEWCFKTRKDNKVKP
jgi:hypothetical protein